MIARLLIPLLALAGIAGTATKPTGPRWRIQYFYDRDDSSFTIRDLRFSSAERGIAAGYVVTKKDRVIPMSVITRDGGKTWAESPLKEPAVSLFLLNDTLGWMVTEKGIWQTDEAGRTWKKLANLRGIQRVFFKDPSTGWATGARKQFLATTDGGRTWTRVPGVDEVKANADFTYFDWIEFLNSKQGIVLGMAIPPRRERGSWMDPDALARRRELPNLGISMETGDGGLNWKPQTAPIIGRLSRYRARGGNALTLVRFVNAFDWPSEVNYISRVGVTQRVYRDKDRKVTDIAWLGGAGLLAAVEPPGRLYELPVAGKIHVLTSSNLTDWQEMPVDYRAFGREAILAVIDEQHAWLATTSGQVLRLIIPPGT